MMRPSDLAQITTQHGHVYTLIHPPLGQGGQGVVFRCKEKHDLLIKLLLNHDQLVERTPSNKLSRLLSSSLEDVRLLALPTSSHVAQPIEELDEYVGYTMRMLQDMMPITELIVPHGEDLVAFYRKTGGLRRRLKLLHHLAQVFQDLHARGICYGDISPANVFVSSDLNYHEVWLIDADNMRLRVCDRAFYTPWYGAPDVVSGKRYPDMRSDCYSFALLAWHVLAQVHAFMGAALDDEEDDWDSDTSEHISLNLEQRVQHGEVPWIHDSTSTENHTQNGVPLELICSPRLKKLFQQTFERGRQEPSERPSMSQWVDAFQSAVMCHVRCPSCHLYYYPSRTCPWCQALRPLTIAIESRLWFHEIDEDASKEEEQKAFQDAHIHARLIQELSEAETLSLGPPLTGALNGPCIELTYEAGFIILRNRSVEVCEVVKPDERQISLRTEERFKCMRGETFHLHCGALNTAHRYLTIHLH